MSNLIPIYDPLDSALIQYGMFYTFLSEDESLLPYYDRHSYKMVIHGKPISFRYKI